MTESFEEVVIDLGLAELIPIPGASRNLLQVGGSTGDRTEITVTTGWSNTKTKEASMSVTASVGGSYGAANFSVSATVGFGYSDSTSLSKETSVKQVYNFRPGYITTYYQWGVHVRDKQILNGKDSERTYTCQGFSTTPVPVLSTCDHVYIATISHH